jgi:hypothetical protein
MMAAERSNELARSRLQKMSREERTAFCREVLEGLSDLVEGEAPADLCARVDEILGDCQAYAAYRETLRSTIELARGCRDRDPAVGGLDDESYRRCVERVRERLAEEG